MQFMILLTRHPNQAETPTPADLREEEFEKVRGLYTDGVVQQMWLRGDAGGRAAEALFGLRTLRGFINYEFAEEHYPQFLRTVSQGIAQDGASRREVRRAHHGRCLPVTPGRGTRAALRG